MNKSIMVIGAHADDIEIHVGGSLLKYYEKGYDIIYIMATNNFSGCWSKRQADGSFRIDKPVPETIMAQRKLEADRGAEIFGTKPIHLDHPQRHYNLPNSSQAELRYGCPLPPLVAKDIPTILTAYEDQASIKRLAELIHKQNPECVLSHGPVQVNIEHAATSLLVTNAWVQAKNYGFAGGLVHWEEGHFIFGKKKCEWDSFINISDYVDKKMAAVAVHESQMPRALEPDFGHRDLALIRGKACGCLAAELFTIISLKQGQDFSNELNENWQGYSFTHYPEWDENAKLKMTEFIRPISGDKQ